ncbi:MAG: VWA domain-containing protein [Elusimicrobia bacterium]|nr:VWA domain-containing protein [Elusimicrobiota bacterium]
MRFADPLYFLLLIPFIAAVIVYLTRTRTAAGAITFSDLSELKRMPRSIRSEIRRYMPVLKSIALVLFIVALARPQKGQKSEELLTRGLDIILCLDTSTSMKAEDFKPMNRLDAAKQAAEEFIKGRKYDRIGIVVFSEMAFTQCPLTLDYGAVLDFLDKVHIGMTQTDGTGIGTAITTSTNRLRKSSAKSKIIILLTDGRNNTGEIDPVTAAKAAQALNIKIYTIGAGKKGAAPFPVEDPLFGKRYVMVKEDLDEETLREIAGLTDGLYFRATNSEMLKTIYKKIDELEKTEIKIKEYVDYSEWYIYFLAAGMLCLIGVLIAEKTYFKTIP